MSLILKGQSQMCGIVGVVYNDRTRLVSEQALLTMRDSLTHRGPDDAGNFIAPGIGLGARRLSIIDLSERGHMPMCTPDGRYWIVYNGEIFNYHDLRLHLEQRGWSFQSNTDTEVVLNLYADEGIGMLPRLNGMFAFAIWDADERTLFIARDRLGVKPLFYTKTKTELLFASEEKALFAGGVEQEFDSRHWEELLCFRYVAGEETPYKNVQRLLPGHYLIWKDGQIRTQRWWNLAEIAKEKREEFNDIAGRNGGQPVSSNAVTWFGETLNDAVRLRLISDVPVGILLSGGLDSSCIAASLALHSKDKISSFTIRFDEKNYDEGELAKQTASLLQLNYNDLKVESKKLLSLIQQASFYSDEPLVHGSDPYLLAISQFAKERVTVLLSGEGADETLGGYVRYRPLHYPNLLNFLRRILPHLPLAFQRNHRINKLSRFLKMDSIDCFVAFNACEVLPEQLTEIGLSPTGEYSFRKSVLQEAKSLYPNEPLRQAMYSDQHTFLCSVLDRNDRMTMGASIECRVPYLDHRLVEGLAALPSNALLSGNKGKPLLRKAMNERLPETVRNHRKWGFGVPWAKYLRDIKELRQLVSELHSLSPIQDSPFNLFKLRTIVTDFLQGEQKHEELIQRLIMIAIWHQSCLNKTNKTTLHETVAID
jgi:asparagine synthase (glutamine-hydrolysing)